MRCLNRGRAWSATPTIRSLTLRRQPTAFMLLPGSIIATTPDACISHVVTTMSPVRHRREGNVG
eukprot:5095496-Prorocentrum_lima.AAC.1